MERALVIRAIEGDQDAFAQLVDAEVLLSLQAPAGTSVVHLDTGVTTTAPDVGEAWGWQRLAP